MNSISSSLLGQIHEEPCDWKNCSRQASIAKFVSTAALRVTVVALALIETVVASLVFSLSPPLYPIAPERVRAIGNWVKSAANSFLTSLPYLGRAVEPIQETPSSNQTEQNLASKLMSWLGISPPLLRTIALGALGLGIGLQLHKLYVFPLRWAKIQSLSAKTWIAGKPSTSIPTANPFSHIIPGNSNFSQISNLAIDFLLTPLICWWAPRAEEKLFRGRIQKSLKEKCVSFYTKWGLPASVAKIGAQATAICCASTVFGLVHFSNAILFKNPIDLFPQVATAAFLGLVFGLAAELSGDLTLPIGMHMGVNTQSQFISVRDALANVLSTVS